MNSSSPKLMIKTKFALSYGKTKLTILPANIENMSTRIWYLAA